MYELTPAGLRLALAASPQTPQTLGTALCVVAIHCGQFHDCRDMYACIGVLKDAGADPSDALTAACLSFRHVDGIRLLMDIGAMPDAACFSALACRARHDPNGAGAIVKVLLESGADPDALAAGHPDRWVIDDALRDIWIDSVLV